MSGSYLLDTNVVIALLNGALENTLREKGRPIPENDIWLAATSLEHNLILVSRDNRSWSRNPGK